MHAHLDRPANEIKRLQRRINDVANVFALPAIWKAGESARIIRTLLDALLRTLSEQKTHAEEFDQRVALQTKELVAANEELKREIAASRETERKLRREKTELQANNAALDSERRLSAEALSKARAELAHVSRVTTLGVLTASIAHEINQPLSGIVTNASTCLRMLAADPPNVDGARETALRTIRDGHRASDVVTRLRALFRKKSTTTESVDLNDTIREVIALSFTELQRNRVTLRTELSNGLPSIAGDRVQLQQVILNLLLNASDAMSGVDDRVRQLTIRTEPDESDGVRVTVRDAGVGIEKQSMSKLFEPFYTTKGGGMGIGLSVSRSIVESHHGRLWATPNDGPGATFSFSIPRGSPH